MNCSRAGCTAEATHKPYFNFWATGYSTETSTPLSGYIDLPVCAEHRDTVKLEEIISETSDAWHAMVKTADVMGKVAPDYKSGRLGFVAITESATTTEGATQ